MLGYFVFSHDEVIATLKKYFVLLLVLGVGVGTAFCIMYFGDNYAEAPQQIDPVYSFRYGWQAWRFLAVCSKYADKQNAFYDMDSVKNILGFLYVHYLGISTEALLLGKPGNLPTNYDLYFQLDCKALWWHMP